MTVSKKSIKPRVLIKTESQEEFFTRGKITARLLDRKKSINPSRIISFEDTADLVRFLTQRKMELIAMIRNQPNSIAGLAKALNRSRAAVDRDVYALESVGLIKSEYTINPGHGRHKLIMAVDKKPIKLQVEAIL
jgi:predicted transcriptional regulator